MTMSIFKSDTINEMKTVLRLFFPKGKIEWALLIIISIFYLSFGLPLSLSSNLLDFESLITDLHFTFDNVIFYHLGRQNVLGHPLIIVFTKPIVILSNLLASLFHDPKIKTIFILFFTTYCTAMLCVVIHRFLFNILKIGNLVAILLCILFANFFACEVLSFTFESFTISLFLLSVMVYFYGMNVSKNTENGLISDVFFTFLVGIVTVTNIAKGLILAFFSKHSYKKGFLRCLIITGIFALLYIAIYNFYNLGGDKLSSLSGRYESFSSVDLSTFGYIMICIDTFFISPIISFDLTTVFHKDFGSITRILHVNNLNDVHSFLLANWWRYLFAVVFYGLIILSIIKNYKNKIFLLLLAVFAVDIFIHLILCFGINEGFFIYSGHWVFIYPLLLGFLYQSTAQEYKKILCAIFVLLASILVINNLLVISDFINLASQYFPAN